MSDSHQTPQPEPGPGEKEKVKPTKPEIIMKSIINENDFDRLSITPRDPIVDSWLLTGDLGFIFAARGVGKTWLGMYLAHCIADKSDCGQWKIKNTQKTLYVDGETSCQDLQYRNRMLGNRTDNLSYLSHEMLYEQSGIAMNFADPELQNTLTEVILRMGFKCVFLDNLSSLVSGIDENKSIDWEKILPWLLQLRREKITVIFIHHAGVDDTRMRGCTKREDAANWIVRLREAKEDGEENKGAHFFTNFVKCRSAIRPKDLEWNFQVLPNNEVLIRCENSSLMDVFLDLVAHGVDSCKDIADEMKISNATITRLAQRAEREGVLEIKNRKYYIKGNGSNGRTYKPKK